MNSTAPVPSSFEPAFPTASGSAPARARPGWAISAVAAAVLVSGCSDGRPPLYPVSGTVLFETGTPVRNASIEFVPNQLGPSPRGRIDAEGRFSLGTYAAQDGAPAGDYRVVVVQALPPDTLRGMNNLGAEHAGHAGSVWVVALKHASPKTTGVTCTVEPIGENDVALVIESR